MTPSFVLAMTLTIVAVAMVEAAPAPVNRGEIKRQSLKFRGCDDWVARFKDSKPTAGKMSLAERRRQQKISEYMLFCMINDIDQQAIPPAYAIPSRGKPTTSSTTQSVTSDYDAKAIEDLVRQMDDTKNPFEFMSA